MTEATAHARGDSAVQAASKGPGPRPRLPRAPAYVFWMLIVFLVLEFVRRPLFVMELKLQFIICLLIPLLWLNDRQRPWTAVLTAQVVFLAWCAKSIPIASNNFAAYMITRTMFANVAIALALTWVGSNLRDFKRVIWVWVAIMTYQGIWSITHGGHGTGGFLGDENDLALACGTAVSLAFFGMERLRGSARWGCAIALVTLIMGIVVSLSRGGFVGLVVASAYCLAKSRHKLRALAIVAIAMVAVPVFAPSTYIDEIRSIQDTDSGTARTRRFLWHTATNMWLEHPILGVGGGNINYLMGNYQPEEGYEERSFQERNWSGTTAHSMYFQLLPEQGIVGVAIVAFLIGYHFRITRRLVRRVRRARGIPRALRRDAELYAFGLNGALLCYLTAGAFLSVAYYPYLWYFTALSCALEIAVRQELSALPPRSQPASREPDIPS